MDLNDVTRNLATFLDKVIAKNIEIKVIPGTLQPVQDDPTQIEQLLMSLCLNSRDAMPDGGCLLIETEMVQLDESYCGFYPEAVAGCYAVLSVTDTGVGMNAKTRERMFEPLFTTKEQGKGSGIGLATAYGIVKRHNGFIHVYSEPGQGSLFRVYLPAVNGGGTNCVSHAREIPPAKSLRGSKTILFAEDHDSIRETVRQTLVSLGYRVLAAADGEPAVELCAEETPALAILDLVMPHLGGAAAACKLLGRFPGLPILFASGYSELSGAQSTQIAGARYLQKPYSPTSLSRTIREILENDPPSSINT